MNPLIESIMTLLAREPSELARVCEEILKSGAPGVSSFELPLTRTRDVYYLRAKLNADQGRPIKGFQSLVVNLQKEREPMIGIHSVAVGPLKFKLFTNVHVTRLIGILLLPPASDH